MEETLEETVRVGLGQELTDSDVTFLLYTSPSARSHRPLSPDEPVIKSNQFSNSLPTPKKPAMHLLTLINSLSLAFLLSELTLKPSGGIKTSTAYRLGAALALVNVILADTTLLILRALSEPVAVFLEAVVSVIHSVVNLLILRAHLIVTVLGPNVLYTLLFGAVLALLTVGLTSRAGYAIGRWVLVVVILLASAAFHAMLWWLTSPHEPLPVDVDFSRTFQSHPEAVRVVTGAVSFSVLCYFDIRRFEPLSVPLFLKHLATSFLYVLPLVPWLAVAVSTVLFVFISLLEFCGLSTDLLGPVVYICTIYGPFITVYFEAKRLACNRDWLPSSYSQQSRRRG